LKAELEDPKRAAQYKDKVKVKGAVSEGAAIGYDQALTMPTKAEAIARVVGLALAPAARLISQITGPASQLASQVKSIAEKKDEGAPAAPAEAAAPPA